VAGGIDLSGSFRSRITTFLDECPADKTSFIIETTDHPGEHHSAKSRLLSTCEEWLPKTRMTILKRSGMALVLAGILLVLIFYLHATRSQQPAQPSKPHKITINWDKAPRAVSYNVYRRLYGSQTFTKVGTSNTNSYDDPGVQGGERYCYVVTSLDSKGTESGRPREICLTVPNP
jgi:hypothetical protein